MQPAEATFQFLENKFLGLKVLATFSLSLTRSQKGPTNLSIRHNVTLLNCAVTCWPSWRLVCRVQTPPGRHNQTPFVWALFWVSWNPDSAPTLNRDTRKEHENIKHYLECQAVHTHRYCSYVIKVTSLPGRNCSSEHTSFRGLWYCLWNTGEPKTPNLLCENPVRQKVLNLTSL